MGVMSYLTPLGQGVNRGHYDWWGWGTPDNAFWCCYGTTVESFGKLPDTVFFEDASIASPAAVSRQDGSRSTANAHDDDDGDDDDDDDDDGGGAVPTAWLISYVPTQLQWRSAGVRLQLWAEYAANASALEAELVVTPLDSLAKKGAVVLRIRIPKWSTGSTITVDGRPPPAATRTTSGAPQPGTFFNLTVAASDSVVTVRHGMGASVVRLNDYRKEYRGWHALKWGPLVLAGVTSYDNMLDADPEKVTEWLLPSSSSSSSSSRDTARPVGTSFNYSWRPGALAAGDDLGEGNYSAAAAEAWCSGTAACKGFTYRAPDRWSTTPVKVYFKSEVNGNADTGWQTYVKDVPPATPVGRVLRFTARGLSGKEFQLLPLNRVVDETYSVYFNLTMPPRRL
jgi:hypothetical protein